MKIVSIVGARPQFIKLAALHRSMLKKPEIEHLIIHSGQHYDENMSAIFFEELDIPQPDINLHINSNSHKEPIVFMQSELALTLKKINPSMVVVFGDTNTTLAGARASYKSHIPVAHVEAGLRSHNHDMPEEYNRINTDKISDLLFCPTKLAMANLVEEQLLENAKVIFSGDIMFDAACYYSKKEYTPSTIVSDIHKKGNFNLVTIHRESTVTSPRLLNQLITALNIINSETRVVMPVHPRTKQSLLATGSKINFSLIDPVSYLDMLTLLQQCTLVITDSGGLQKEAFFFKKFCVSLRYETEWQELVEAGVNILAGTNVDDIQSAYHLARSKHNSFDQNFYGDGNAGDIIVNEILRYHHL